MVSRVITFAIQGLDPRVVLVEVDMRPGLPAFTIVGLADRAVREARERVRAAILNSGFEFPQRRVTVNLAPAYLRKAGPGFDLAIACGILAASGQVPAGALERFALHAELSLSGELRPTRGALVVAEGTVAAGLEALIVDEERAHEAALVEGLTVAGVPTLAAAAAVLRGGEIPALPPAPAERRPEGQDVDLADVLGHAEALDALTLVAAGGHNLLMSGPPGTGKTMLARRLPTILAPMSRTEAMEVTRVHSIAGLHGGWGLVPARPFRAPHHTISCSGLVGGGAAPRPGEVSLAHNGVLFLDEVSEFSHGTLEALRQPLEDGTVAVVRGQRAAVYPSRTMLVAATNPCPCGYAGTTRCRCDERDHARHARRLSGPLLDRVDVMVHVERPTADQLAGPPLRSSAAARDLVAAARERQQVRLRGTGVSCNAHMGAALVRAHARLDSMGERRLRRAYERGHLSARGHQRILRVALSIADLEGASRITDTHVLRAISLRVDWAAHAEATA